MELMKSIDSTIAALEEKLRQAKAKKQQAEARQKAADQKRKRTEDTRRKVLVGAVVLARVERGEWPEFNLLEMLGNALTRDDDRALFGLAPVAPKITNQATTG